jgi:hypothetical protein
VNEDYLGVFWHDGEPRADALGSRRPTGDDQISSGVHRDVGDPVRGHHENQAIDAWSRGSRRPLDDEPPAKRRKLLLPAEASTVTRGDDYRPDRAQLCALLA